MNPRAATRVNADRASSTPPACKPTQLELFPGRACAPKAKPATDRKQARQRPIRRDGVLGGGTRRKRTKITGETLFGPAEKVFGPSPSGREAYKGRTRNRRNDAGRGVGGGHTTDEPRDNRGEGRAATSTKRSKQVKAAGLPPRGKAQPRTKPSRRKAPERLDKARKLQRTLSARGKSNVAADPRVGRSRERLFSRTLRPTRGSAATVHGCRRLLPRAAIPSGQVTTRKEVYPTLRQSLST